jgi:hypothetical protein
MLILFATCERRCDLTMSRMKRFPGDDDPLIEMLSVASEKPPDDVIAALARFPPGPQRGELAFNVLFGTQVYGQGDESVMPPDADQVGVQRYQISKEERRRGELEREASQLQRTVSGKGRERTGGGGGSGRASQDAMLALGPLLEWDPAPCAFTQIAGTYSELLALGADGLVYRWHWDTADATTAEVHPCAPLSTTGTQNVKSLAVSELRVSYLTKDGAVGTWLDESMWTCMDIEKREEELDSSDEEVDEEQEE